MGCQVLPDDFHQLLFFLIARRCLVQVEDFCPISLNTLRKQLTLYTFDLFNRRSIAKAIARIRDAGLIKARDPDAGFAGTSRTFSSLFFEITPLGLDYVDQLTESYQDQEENFGGESWII